MHCGFVDISKDSPVENEVTNAYLQNTVNWPLPACKSGESGDVDETSPLEIEIGRFVGPKEQQMHL